MVSKPEGGLSLQVGANLQPKKVRGDAHQVDMELRLVPLAQGLP